MITGESESQPALDKATEAVRDAADAVRTTTASIAGAIDDSRRPGGTLDWLSRTTREAPLRSLVMAFVVGLIVARR